MGLNTSHTEDMCYALECRITALSREMDKLKKRIRALERDKESTVEVVVEKK